MARKHRMYTGLLGPVTETTDPAQVQGVVQYGGELIPSACPHCREDGPMWVRDERLGTCWACGQDFYATRYVIAKPRSHASGNPHPVPIHE